MNSLSNVLRGFLCTGLLVCTGMLAHGQQPSTQQAPGAAGNPQQAPAPADNTKTNQRDQSSNEPTADQQKENPSDREITQRIRQSLLKDKSLSSYAHNVKIITQNGNVTLKGPVRSSEEKQAVEVKAAEVAGQGKVTNDLDIQPKD